MTMMDTSVKELAAAMAAAQKATSTYGEIPHVSIPEGMRVEDIERLLPAPSRIRGVYTTANPVSWAKYIERFRSDATVIFAQDKQAVAVLDFHTRQTAGWGEHLAILNGHEISKISAPEGVPVFFGEFSTIETE